MWVYVLFLSLTMSCISSWGGSNTYNTSQSKFTFSDTTYRIIPSQSNTYGYEIIIHQKVIIRQQNIPGRPGNNGFAKEKDARKVAELVLKKLRDGIMPPTIEKRELDSLKITY